MLVIVQAESCLTVVLEGCLTINVLDFFSVSIPERKGLNYTMYLRVFHEYFGVNSILLSL